MFYALFITVIYRSLRHTGQLLPAKIDEVSQAWMNCAQRDSFSEEVSAPQSSAKNCCPH